MRRVAASRVYINEKEFHNNHVVELLNHSVINHYPLREELPMTEWLGGAIIITSANIPDSSLATIRAISDFYPQNTPSSDVFIAYHVSAFNITEGMVSTRAVVRKL